MPGGTDAGLLQAHGLRKCTVHFPFVSSTQDSQRPLRRRRPSVGREVVAGVEGQGPLGHGWEDRAAPGGARARGCTVSSKPTLPGGRSSRGSCGSGSSQTLPDCRAPWCWLGSAVEHARASPVPSTSPQCPPMDPDSDSEQREQDGGRLLHEFLSGPGHFLSAAGPDRVGRAQALGGSLRRRLRAPGLRSVLGGTTATISTAGNEPEQEGNVPTVYPWRLFPFLMSHSAECPGNVGSLVVTWFIKWALEHQRLAPTPNRAVGPEPQVQIPG